MHFIAKQFVVTNRTTVAFKTCTGAKNPPPPPYRWFSYKSEMPNDCNYDDDCSCGLYCCNFLLNFYIKLGRIDPGIIPDVASKILWEYTKSCKFFLATSNHLLNLILLTMWTTIGCTLSVARWQAYFCQRTVTVDP